MEKGIVKPLTLEINFKTWEQYKQIVPRGTTLNQSVVELIEEKLKRNKK